MGALETLIETLKLDQSFFYQLALSAALYFILKKILFQPYLKKMEERHQLTKGRLKGNKERESEIEKLKIAYEKKAKKIHKEFQEFFNKAKESAEKDFLRQSRRLKEEQAREIKKQRESLARSLKDQNQLLEKEAPALAELLAERAKG